MSLWAEYCKERLDAEVIETDHSFVAYQMRQTEAFILELYVSPDKRRLGETRNLIHRVCLAAKEAGRQYVTGKISPGANGSTGVMAAAIRLGFELLRSDPDSITIYKDLNKWVPSSAV
jgi:hypothetical protein